MKTIGNFCVDLVRVTYYLLVPICVVFAIVLVSQGMIQNFKPFDSASLSDPFTTPGGMPAYRGNPLVDANIEGIYRYFAERVDGSISPEARPAVRAAVNQD